MLVAAAAASWALSASVAAPSRAQDLLTSGRLQVQGSRLTLYSDGSVDDADQVIAAGESARVRTCYGSSGDGCGLLQAGDPAVAGLEVVGDLSGPEVPGAIELRTVPGGSFVVPSFQQPGDYLLANIRLVETATGEVLTEADPPLAILRVREIVVASATVRALTLEDLRERGLSLDRENFDAFEFAVGFAFGTETVEIRLPVLYDGYGTATALAKPEVQLEGLAAETIREVSRWQPPNIVPFKLELSAEAPARTDVEELEELVVPVFGAVVMPGSVTVLHQFFDATLVVANGAPLGSSAQLSELTGAVRLPPNNVLRLAKTDPTVLAGQPVPVVAADGARTLAPGEQGAASWTVEGLAPGTWTLGFAIAGLLERPGRDPLPVTSGAQAAVDVVDTRFHLTFAHPKTVREGEEYSMFATVSNLSRVAQNLVTVSLDDQRITGAHKADPLDDFSPTIETLEAGASSTVEFRLVADVTGSVIATTFQSSDQALTGTIRLRAGVGELGIPLSPATLILPRFSERLKPPYTSGSDYYDETLRFLGLAWSHAVAPASLTPRALPRVIRSDVERRAIDLGEAGQRTFLHEGLLESLEGLLLDQLGNRHELLEIDELRRLSDRGLRIGEAMAGLLREEQVTRSLDAEDLLDHWAETHSYRDPFVLALFVPDDPAAGLNVELRGDGSTGGGVLVGRGSGPAPRRGLRYGEILALHDGGLGDEEALLAVVGRLEEGRQIVASLVNADPTPRSGRLIVVVPRADGSYRKVDLGSPTVPAGASWAVTLGAGIADPSGSGFELFDLATGASVAAPVPTLQEVPLPPFRVIGAVQDFLLGEEGPSILGNFYRPNRYGHGVAYLFNRPPARESAELAGSYRIRSQWSGLDASGAPASTSIDKIGTAAWVQDSERVVLVRYSSPIAAMADGSGPLVDHAHQLDVAAILDRFGESLSSTLPEVAIETTPLHVGGLVGGRVVRGDGGPAAGATVTLIRPRIVQTLAGFTVKSDIVGSATTDAQGEYAFDFVELPHWDSTVQPSFRLRASVPAGADPILQPAETQEVGTTLRQQNRMARVNIAFLGRGTLTGRLVWEDTGEPVLGGWVRATSDLFDEDRSLEVGGDGSFQLGGVPVGPITLTGGDEAGHRVYATVGLERPGAVVDATLRLPRRAPVEPGSVTGVVVRRTREQPLEEAAPVEGARVQIYADGVTVGITETDGLGRFALAEIPAGRVSVQAADWRVSRTAAFTDLVLHPGESAGVTLVLVEGATRSVHGRVELDDPFGAGRAPIEGAAVFVAGPGNFAFTDANGEYVIEGLPVQGVGDSAYQVTAIDFERRLQGVVSLPDVLDVSPEVIEAQTVVLREMRGAIDGVVLDALGRPASLVEVIDSRTLRTTISGLDGSFSFEDLGVGGHTLTAHVGNGLGAGQVGSFGSATTDIVLGGHRPFVTIRMRGSGRVRIHTRTSSGDVQTPIFYRPTHYSGVSKAIQLQGPLTETTTSPTGRLELELPVGAFDVFAYNPFHGVREVHREIDYQGQVVDLDVLFEDASTVLGVVLDVDGRTPVPDFEVTLRTEALLPQTQRTAPDGTFRFELVPKGRVALIATGYVGAVERVGRTDGIIGTAGQELELPVTLEAQGTVRGRVLSDDGQGPAPVANAQVFLEESTFPYRRLPEGGAFFFTDSAGRYEIPHVYAGAVRVVARDPSQVTRSGAAFVSLDADWSVVEAPDIVFETLVGTLEVLVRDPATGGPIPDAQVRLRSSELTVSGPDGVAAFAALPLGTRSVYVFDAPTGRSGRLDGVQLSEAGAVVRATVYVDERGEVRGTVYDDDVTFERVAGATVELVGTTSSGPLRALATTGGEIEAGEFRFLGIPEGTFALTAAPPTSTRRGSATVTLTETSPIADINLFLEPVRDLHVRLFESLVGGMRAVDAGQGDFSVRLTQGATGYFSYDFTQILPLEGTDVFLFPEVLTGRRGWIHSREVGGELRGASSEFYRLDVGSEQWLSNPLTGSGTLADPYRMTLAAKGVVRVTVTDSLGGSVAGAPVTLRAPGARLPSVTGADGTVTFFAVPAGALTASANDPATGLGGVVGGTLTYDDEAIDLAIVLAPAVSARGTVYEPLEEGAGFETAVPQESAIVVLVDAANRTQTAVTGPDGTFQLDGLALGSFGLEARDTNGDGLASLAGSLAGPQGTVHDLGAIVLDASPPRIVSITPPAGLEGVSRTATVEIVFSEPLDPSCLPTGQPASSYFSLSSESGASATGTWTSRLEGRQQVIRFSPSDPYENQSLYSVRIMGGPGGVRDLQQRLLTAAGVVGSNFRTADGVGPEVTGTVPSLDERVDPAATIRVDFNEELTGAATLFDGDGVGDAAELYGERDSAGVLEWVRLPVSLGLTRLGYSLDVRPVGGISLTGDTLRRRLVVGGLQDAAGNAMPPWDSVYRVHDDSGPTLTDVLVDPAAEDGLLLPGNDYRLSPQLAGLDDSSPEKPFGDLARVEYFLVDPTDPANGALPTFTASSAPFELSFVAAYSGDGVEARPFPVWVRAVDTSTNESNVVHLDLRVEPNEPPVLDAVEVTAIAPVADVFYAGSRIRSTASGLSDPDAPRLTLRAELRAQGGAELLDSLPGRALDRPADGWAELEPQTFEFTIPVERAEGEELFVRMEVLDSQGAGLSVDSTPFAVADDAGGPEIAGVEALLTSGEQPEVVFIGEQFWIEVEATDVETAVREVTVELDRDDLLPSPLAAFAVPGQPTRFRTDPMLVPAAADELTEVEATVTVDDWGGNSVSSSHRFDIGPEPDPTAPTTTWLTPWNGAEWPAEYTSVLGGAGTDLLLRADVVDVAEDAGGQEVPGTIAEVWFRGPVLGASGEIELAGTWKRATPVAGTVGPGTGTFEALWQVPNGISAGTELRFEVRAHDTGGLVAAVPARMSTVPARQVYEGAERSVLGSDPMLMPGGDPEGPVFLLDGSIVSVFPQEDETVRAIGGLVVYGGGDESSGSPAALPSVLTAPEITTHASAVQYHPLELEIGRILSVGHGSRIDVTGRGLLGNSSAVEMVLPGETRPEGGAGGSHGGWGWYGYANLLEAVAERPGTLYDSVREPRLPGGGGSYRFGDGPGGTGGGVIRLLAPDAVVHLAGDLLADAAPTVRGGGGAGGTIRLTASLLEGPGRIRADGAAATQGFQWDSMGSGGGGRISISYAALGDGFDAEAQVSARGGEDWRNNFDRRRQGGAGTVYLERIDAETHRPVSPGELLVVNPETYPSAATVLPTIGAGMVLEVDPGGGTVLVDRDAEHGSLVGEELLLVASTGAQLARLRILSQSRELGPSGPVARFGVEADAATLDSLALQLAGEPVSFAARRLYSRVRVGGSARLAIDDGLELLLPEDGTSVLDDRNSIELGVDARVAVRGENPLITLTTAPPSGADLLPNATIEVGWRVDDPLGLERVETEWTLDGAPVTTHFGGPPSWSWHPTEHGASLQLEVPPTQGPGVLAYRVTASDLGKRQTTTIASWTVVGDQTPPTVTVELTPAVEGDLYTAGDAVTVTATAVDDVEVASLELTVDGRTFAGTSPLSVSFTVPPQTALASYDFTASATDLSGNTGSATKTLQAAPLVNAVPPTVEVLCLTPGALLPSAATIAVGALATDDVGVWSVELSVLGEAEPFAVLRPAFGTPPSFEASASWTVPDAASEQAVTLRAVAYDASSNASLETLVPVRVKPAVELLPDGAGVNDWSALESESVYLSGGVLTLDAPRRFGDLILLEGSTLTHAPAVPGLTSAVDVQVSGAVHVACGAQIDVSRRGYAPRVSESGAAIQSAEAGASHVGQGGLFNGSFAETFGSLERPVEPGAGGNGGGPNEPSGGGVVHVTAGELILDGDIRANGWEDTGQQYATGGAGGSIWLEVEGPVAGRGTLQAHGGLSGWFGRGSGGGGAVSVTHGGSGPGSFLDTVDVGGGANGAPGAAGSIWIRGPGDAFGALTLDQGSVASTATTVLPSFGAGVAAAGTAGATLVTDRSEDVESWLLGHWVEVRDGESGDLEGTWRIASIDGVSVTLEPNGAEALDLGEGDRYQGVYRVDRLTVTGSTRLRSIDPIRVTGEQILGGRVELTEVLGTDLLLPAGTVLAGVPPASGSLGSLRIALSGSLVVEASAVVDVSGLGYGPAASYPGVGVPGSYTGGSHIGRGGLQVEPWGETYGSLYRPREAGGGAGLAGSGSPPGTGGGVLEIEVGSLVVDGTLRANGASSAESYKPAGAGGSVWIRATGSVGGSGAVEAIGGYAWIDGSGGGGALSIEYGSASGTLLDNLRAHGNSGPRGGGAGSIYLLGPTGTYGDVRFDNVGIAAPVSPLPSLGSGVAASGSGGDLLVTDRVADIPEFFAGHWVEVRDATTGVLEGTFRVERVVDGDSLVLRAEDGAPAPSVEPGDAWQGVYRFDSVEMADGGLLTSEDPIRVTGQQVIRGGPFPEMTELRGHNLTVRGGTTLTSPTTTDPASPTRLEIDVTGTFTLEEGAVIDVTGRGFRPYTSYPGVGIPGAGSGGSHLGEGGLLNEPPGETFGSVTRPREPGGGTTDAAGGGVVRIRADDVVLDGQIYANGTNNVYDPGGAGGSVWITATGTITGDGLVEARGQYGWDGGKASGGGGAIVVEHQGASGSWLDNVLAVGSPSSRNGGAGTILHRGPSSVFGDLVVDNAGRAGNTVLPSLGAGVAQAGSGGVLLVTDRVSIHPFFEGHWVEVTDPGTGLVRGTWQIASITGAEITLEGDGTEPPTVQAGDSYQGIYRFDTVTVVSPAVLSSVDPIVEEAAGSALVRSPSETSAFQDGPPTVDPAGVRLLAGGVPFSYAVDVAPLAVADGNGISRIRVTDGLRSATVPWSAEEGARLLWTGRPGQRLRVQAIDRHSVLRRGAEVALPPLPKSGGEAFARLTMPDGESPRLVAADRGGAEARWFAVADRSVRVFAADGRLLFDAPPAPLERAGGDRIEALAATDGFAATVFGDRLDLVHVTSDDDRVLEVAAPAGERGGGVRVLGLAALEGRAGFAVLLRRDDRLELRRITGSSGRLDSLDDARLTEPEALFRDVAGVGSRAPSVVERDVERLASELRVGISGAVGRLPNGQEGDLLRRTIGEPHGDGDGPSIGIDGVGRIVTEGGQLVLRSPDGLSVHESRTILRLDRPIRDLTAFGRRIALLAGDLLIVARVDDDGGVRDLLTLSGVAHGRVALGREHVVLHEPGGSVPAVVAPIDGLAAVSGGFRLTDSAATTVQPRVLDPAGALGREKR